MTGRSGSVGQDVAGRVALVGCGFVADLCMRSLRLAAMNFARGPVEMLAALAEGRACRRSNDMALHLTEATLAIQGSDEEACAQSMTTTCMKMEPAPWA